MKVLFGAAAATVLLAGVAMAQTTSTTAPTAAPVDNYVGVVAPTHCSASLPPPSLPDAATANAAAMTAGNAAYTTWATAQQAVLICRSHEVKDLRATAEALTTEHNAGAEQLRSVTESWVASATAFNARTNRRSHNSGGH